MQCTNPTLHQHIMKDGVDIELLHTLLSLGQGINAKDDVSHYYTYNVIMSSNAGITKCLLIVEIKLFKCDTMRFV